MKQLFYIIFGLVVLASCKSDDDSAVTPVAPNQEVLTLNVDVILPNDVRKSLQPAIDDAMEAIDDAQENCTKRVKLNLRYHNEDTEDLTKLAYALVNPGKGVAPYTDLDTCHAIIGPWHSDHARTILNQAQRQRLPVMMSCTSAELQRSEAAQTNAFFLVESDITQCEVLLSSILRLGHSRVALLYSDDSYGQSYRDWFGFLATELHLEPVSGGIRNYHRGDNLNDYFGLLADQAATMPVALVIALGNAEDYPAVLEARKQFASSDNGRAKATAPIAYVTHFGLSDASLRYEVAGISPVGSASDGYMQSYKVLHQEVAPFGAAQVYDALSIIALGRAAQAYAANPDELTIDNRRVSFETAPYGPVLSDWMRAILANNNRATETLWIGYGLAQAFQLLETGIMPSLRGATGNLDFDPQTHTTILNTLYMLWQSPGDGRYIPYATVSTTQDGGFSMQNIWDWERQVYDIDPNLGADVDHQLPAVGERWAVVVSPSTTWNNYRHQADAFAVYQLLRHHGYDDDHIVLIVEDNLADDPQNPMPGQIYIDRSKDPNPDDPLMNTDVRKNAVVDYHFSDLDSPDDLGYILSGRASDRLPHVIRPTKSDNVFLFWSGHGGDGDGPLWGDENARQAFGSQRLRDIISQMQYRRMLLAVEACYSGLWGEAVAGLPDVLVLSAANAYETSKADVYDAAYRTFLSNAFARTFRAIISQKPDVLLRDLYNSLARATSGSHVSLYNIEQYGSVYNNDMSDYIVP